MDIQGTKSKKLDGKKIALCVTGSIAATETPKLARGLIRHEAFVQVFMSEDAKSIIHPNAMEFATGNEVITKLTGKLEHLYDFDLILIAPATANTISKIACGIADTPIATLVLSSSAKVIIASAMHTNMYKNKILMENIRKLERHGFGFVEPRFEEGKAKLAGIEDILNSVIFEACDKDLEGRKVLVTAGPTIEYIDPIRIITNKSSGKMGIEIAKEAYFRGAEVKLVYGFGTEEIPEFLEVIKVESTIEMLKAVEKEIARCDVFISAAAPSDFALKSKAHKIESEKDIDLKLVPTPKILDAVKKSDAFKVGFKALHQVSKKDLIKAGRESLEKYGLNLVVANDVSKGAFRSDENEVYVVGKDEVIHIPKTSKREIAEKLLGIIKDKVKR